jgi:hypothetical protein
MENKEYIESGILELTFMVYSVKPKEEVTTMAKNNPEVNAEIAIEKRCVFIL